MKVGDKVVCVDRAYWYNIQVGNIYHVTGISICQCGVISVSISEHSGGEMCYKCDTYCPSNKKGWFDSSCFRPVEYAYGEEVCEAIETEFKELKQPELCPS